MSLKSIINRFQTDECLRCHEQRTLEDLVQDEELQGLVCKNIKACERRQFRYALKLAKAVGTIKGPL